MDWNLQIVEVWDHVVQKGYQEPHQAALGLPLFAEKEQVVLCQQRDVDLRKNRLVVADDARVEFLASSQPA